MTISREAVLWGFRFFLGREAGSEEAIEAHMQLDSTRQLGEILLKSREFSIGKPFGDLLTVNHHAPVLSQHGAHEKVPRRIIVMGNCQAAGLARLLQAMTPDTAVTSLELNPAVMSQLKSGAIDLAAINAQTDLAFMHPHEAALELIQERSPELRSKLKLIPPITFSAFHPDLVYVRDANRNSYVRGPLGDYQSSLALYGWKTGLTVAQTTALFNERVFAHLGFFSYEAASRQFLVQTGEMTGIDVESLVDGWSARGCWMHSINHPKLFVLADIARAILEREGIAALPDAEQYVPDPFLTGPAWPVYPQLARRRGFKGSYLFKKLEAQCPAEMPVQTLELAEFVQASFDAFSQSSRDDLVCDRLDSQAYQELAGVLATPQEQVAQEAGRAEPSLARATAPPGANPYRDLPSHQFWRRGVERVPMAEVDPVLRAAFQLEPQDRIATAGSCFAQHISRTLQNNGFNYFVAENADSAAPAEALRRNFGVFSARYGNIYTARQLVQLFDRAYGTFEPQEGIWLRSDGRLVDAFRPQVEPDGFETDKDLLASRSAHFEAVRGMFESLDVFVFTLGLTEAWRSRRDGAVFPLAPGVAAGKLDTALHEFVNFGVADVVSDLEAFVLRLKRVNAGARMILTVSPVPLIATYEARHVLVSTTYSKSVLRAAAEEVCNRHASCKYFPSYEVITGNFNRGAYFDDDLRSVRPEGVDHVMRLFTAHYFGRKESDAVRNLGLLAENANVGAIICDEEAIDRQESSAAPPRALGRLAERLKSFAGRSRTN